MLAKQLPLRKHHPFPAPQNQNNPQPPTPSPNKTFSNPTLPIQSPNPLPPRYTITERPQFQSRRNNLTRPPVIPPSIGAGLYIADFKIHTHAGNGLLTHQSYSRHTLPQRDIFFRSLGGTGAVQREGGGEGGGWSLPTLSSKGAVLVKCQARSPVFYAACVCVSYSASKSNEGFWSLGFSGNEPWKKVLADFSLCLITITNNLSPLFYSCP